MAKILVIDDEAVIREPIAASIRAKGHFVTCADSSQTALAHVKLDTPDLILLDVRMPVRDGISTLRELRAAATTAVTPVILLTNASEKGLIVQAAELGAQGYILKAAFSLDDLLARIARFCKSVPDAMPGVSAPVSSAINLPQSTNRATDASPPTPQQCSTSVVKPTPPNASSWPRILTAEQTLARIEEVASGKTLAGVVHQLISVTSSSNSDLSDIVRVVESDPILAARVLQLANGASSGTRARVRSVEDAARNLGVRVIQNMANSIGIVGTFPPDEQDGFNIMRCWQHSYAVADLLSMLNRHRNPEQEGVSHLVGLCHELGEMLLRQYFSAEYEQIVQFATAHSHPICTVQSIALGIRPPELIGRLLTRIGLPTQVVQTIRDFFEWQIRPQGHFSANVSSLNLANLGAHGLLLAPSLGDAVRPVTRIEWRQLGIDALSLTIDPEIKRNEILTATSILAQLPAKEMKRSLTPLIPRRTLRLWYVRPDTFAEFDPLAFALVLSGDLVISRDLPRDGQWHEIDAMILVGMRSGIPPILPNELLGTIDRIQRGDLPILALVAQEATCEKHKGLLLHSYPITLKVLSEWLASIPGRA